MVARAKNKPRTPEEQVRKGEFPSRKDQFPPGVSGNPNGRKTAGASLCEWLNSFAEQELTEADLRVIARDVKAPWTKRAAAERVLRTMEAGDVADMGPLLDGSMSPEQLREAGINTAVIKKIKTKTRTLYRGNEAEGVEVEREVELHDRAGVDFDRIADRTAGKPINRVDVAGEVDVTFTLNISNASGSDEPSEN